MLLKSNFFYSNFQLTATLYLKFNFFVKNMLALEILNCFLPYNLQ
jgi:hypothetical protein